MFPLFLDYHLFVSVQITDYNALQGVSMRVSAMDGKNNYMIDLSLATFSLMMVVILAAAPFSEGFTDPQDVYAINNLYVSLSSPPLPGWIPNGGDPCTESWQGVKCVNSNITSIVLNGANLGGQLGDKLENFTSIITIDLSNNHIGGSIPENLPLTMMTFFLSANQFMGSLPSSLSELTLLSDISVNNNLLTGVLPDAFQSLSSLVNLDLSSNNFNGPLPPSMEGLSSLTTLHVQNNQLSGALDVLQDLPLKDLNIENNLFSGPVPAKLLSIPNFQKDGNPFNSTAAPSSSSSPAPPLPPSGTSVPESMPSDSSGGDRSHHREKGTSTKKVVAYVLVAVISVFVVVLATMFSVSKWQEKKRKHEEIPKWQEGRAHGEKKSLKSKENLIRASNKLERDGFPKTASVLAEERIVNEMPKEPKSSTNSIKLNSVIEKSEPASSFPNDVSNNTKNEWDLEKKNIENEHEIAVAGTDVLEMPPLAGKVILNPRVPTGSISRPPPQTINLPTSVKSFSVASLQQYTNSFKEENLIRDCRFGNIYMAVLPEGKAFSVMKLDNVYSNMPIDEFLELVLSISELQHPNIVELMGYCSEFGQRLLVYNYVSKITLHDILHSSDDFQRNLSWNARIQIALGAAKALEYLHEGCNPPIVHQNFEPVNVFLDDELAVHVSECGLASLVSFNSVTQLADRLHTLFSYEAPEVNESGLHTDRSDVYSFGVVMLELLTGRKPYDSSRPRAEQHLVRWASSQIYDINALSKMVDPSINGSYPVKSLSRFADIISRCIQRGPEFRPPMSQVTQDLSRILDEAVDVADGDTSNLR